MHSLCPSVQLIDGRRQVWYNKRKTQTDERKRNIYMEQLLETGKIVTLHALKGEVKVEPWCDSPELLAEVDEL